MTTNLVPALWIVWAVVVLVTGVLYAYRAAVTREERTQSEITQKVNRLQPVLRVSVVLTTLMTAAVITYYVWQGYQSLFG